MKGTIVKCMQDLVTRDFGKDKWQASRFGIDLGQSDRPISDAQIVLGDQALQRAMADIGPGAVQREIDGELTGHDAPARG